MDPCLLTSVALPCPAHHFPLLAILGPLGTLGAGVRTQDVTRKFRLEKEGLQKHGRHLPTPSGGSGGERGPGCLCEARRCSVERQKDAFLPGSRAVLRAAP